MAIIKYENNLDSNLTAGEQETCFPYTQCVNEQKGFCKLPNFKTLTLLITAILQLIPNTYESLIEMPRFDFVI